MKCKKMKRLLALTLAGAMLLSACGSTGKARSAAGEQNKDKAAVTDGGQREDITFTIFDPNPAAKIPPPDAPVMQQIYEATGVRIEWILPVAGAEERLNIMLASGEMPDVINFSSDYLTDTTLMQQFIDAGMILKLNDLAAEYTPELLEVNWQHIIDRIADENGDLWYFPARYTFPDTPTFPEAWSAVFNVRTDYFEENGYDKVPGTFAEYEAVLKDIKADTDMAPLALALGPQGYLKWITAAGAGAYGLPYADNLVMVDDELMHITQAPQMKEYFRFLNSLYRQGLMHVESPVLSEAMLQEKCVAREVWSFIGRRNPINTAVNAFEAANGSDTISIEIYPKADETIPKAAYATYTENLFTGGLAMTTSCKDPARFMEFYAYLNTEEGFLKQFGIVNFDWDGTPEGQVGYDLVVHKDEEYIPGRPYVGLTDWMGDMWASDENWWWNHGIDKMWAFTYNELSNHPDGKYDVVGGMDPSIWWNENATRINKELGRTRETFYDIQRAMSADVSEFTQLRLNPDSQEYLMDMDIIQAVDKWLPRVITADTADAFETEWAAMEKELNKLGLDAVMAQYRELHQERIAKWER